MAAEHPTAPPTRSDNSAYAGSSALVPATRWADLSAEARHRQAAAAASAHDVPALLALADCYLTLYGRAGARVSAHTRAAYREGMRQLLAAWTQEHLLQPGHDAGAVWVRRLEADGASPSTVRVRLAGARMLYRALRWANATKADPFTDARAAPETTAPWDKRQPYSEGDITRLLHVADTSERVIVLLGAHGGLRVAEMCGLSRQDVADGALFVRHGKGGKARHVQASRSLREALEAIPVENSYVLAGLNPDGVRYRLQCLAERAGVVYRGVHALRHSCGTRLLRDGASTEDAARHLGHSSTETTRIYQKWSSDGLKRRLSDW